MATRTEQRWKKLVDDHAALDGVLRATTDERLFRVVPSVSHWSVAQQLDHTYEVSMRILRDLIPMLARGESRPGPTSPTFRGILVLITGRIPRGVGKTPIPLNAEITRASLARASDQVKGILEALKPLLPQVAASKATAPHPVIGGLTAHHWLSFAEIHTHHHQKIIAEILAAS